MRLSRSDTLGRFCIFNVVGGLGIAVQLLILTLLREWAGVHYLAATALAVEGAVLHNFFWHECWTWSDRTSSSRSAILRRLSRFNLTTGAVSIASNLGLMKVCVDTLNLHYFPANLLAITVTSIVNFLLSDRFVFPGCHKSGDSSRFPGVL